MSKHVTREQVARELASTAETLPIVAQLAGFFTEKRMFDSFDDFADEGFKLVKHPEYKMMSGTHRLLPGYIFKKYNNDKDGQLLNYMRRIEGARLLRRFIEERDYQHVTAPRKWLYELPSGFPERYLLIAEKLDLASERSTLRHYGSLSKKQTVELARVLYYFRGLNSTPANLPFTTDDKIAFIDTERWANDKDYLRKVGDRLSPSRREQAESIYRGLRKRGEKPFRSAFK